MPLLPDILNWVGDNLPFTPVGRGILAAREQQQMSQYRNQLMQRQQQQWDLEKSQTETAQRMFKPGAPAPDQIPVTPTVGSPGYDQARQKLDQTDIGTASAVDYLKGPASQVAQSLAGAGQFGTAAQLLKENVPQEQYQNFQSQNDPLGMGGAGQINPKTGQIENYTRPQTSAGSNTFKQMTPDELEQWGLPKGTVAAMGSNGKPDVVFNPQARDAAGPEGPYAGNSIEAQDTNVLLKGDTSSPLYAAAYARQASPRVLPDGTRFTPDMRAYKKPQTPEFAGSPGGPAPRPAGQPTVTPGGLQAAKQMNETMSGLLTNAKAKMSEVTASDRAAYLTSGVSTPKMAAALASWNFVVSQLRDPSLLNTGVLQAGELAWINSFMQSPTSFSAFLQGDKPALATFDEIMVLLRAKQKGYEAIAEKPDSTPDAADTQGSRTEGENVILKWNPEKQDFE